MDMKDDIKNGMHDFENGINSMKKGIKRYERTKNRNGCCKKRH